MKRNWYGLPLQLVIFRCLLQKALANTQNVHPNVSDWMFISGHCVILTKRQSGEYGWSCIMNFLKYGQRLCLGVRVSYDSHNNEDAHIIFNHLGNSLQSHVKRLLYFLSSLCTYTIIVACSPVWMKNIESVISTYHLFKHRINCAFSVVIFI